MVPIGLQLFAVRGDVARDLPTTLAGIARIGYAGVEPWGYDGASESWQGLSGSALRQLLDDNGLRCCGMHLTTGAIQPENRARTIALNQALGNKFVIVAMDAARMTSRAGIQELADILDEAAQALAPLGLQTGYHAHGFDFALVDGEPAWNRLFAATRPEVVMQMDTGNCAGGGGDPMDSLRRFPGRARSVHLKEFGGAPGAVIGEGDADWPEIFRLCETEHHTEWYVVEEGSDDGTGLEIPARSLEGLRRLGKL
jgi:sugar phosphate isomerase/epimerase